jgi:CRP/FNR family cyclic AMP-dependent transcriptional regulator
MDAAATPNALDALNLSPAWRALAERVPARRYRKGTLLIEEGAEGDAIYLVLVGRLRVFSIGPNDREITFGLYGPGDYVGEMSLDGGPRSASVITEEPTTCAIVTRQTLRDQIAAHPELAFELLAKVIRRARMATRDARNLALIDTYGRLIALLDELAVPQADGTRAIEGPLTHREIAARVGCSREMVSRLLKDLENGGYVVGRGRRLVVQRALPPRW